MSTKITYNSQKIVTKPTFEPLEIVCLNDLFTSGNSLLVQCSEEPNENPSFFTGMVVRANGIYGRGFISGNWSKSSFRVWSGVITMESKEV